MKPVEFKPSSTLKKKKKAKTLVSAASAKSMLKAAAPIVLPKKRREYGVINAWSQPLSSLTEKANRKAGTAKMNSCANASEIFWLKT